jgi:hypothetical protein
MSTSPDPAVRAAAETAIGIAWYPEEVYDRIMALMADGASFPKTWTSWRQKAVRMERELKRQGLRPMRVEVDPETFQRWCEKQGLPLDSEARNRYVIAEVARRSA